MDYEDDAPPDLVDVAGDHELEQQQEEGEEEVPFKVPITIVTGTTEYFC